MILVIVNLRFAMYLCMTVKFISKCLKKLMSLSSELMVILTYFLSVKSKSHNNIIIIYYAAYCKIVLFV